MAPTANTSRPGRSLGILVASLSLLFGTLAAGTVLGDAEWSPKLALDLEGGTEIILKPVLIDGQGEVPQESIRESVNIIRQRVNGSGVTEAEVTSEGSGKIVVALAGKIDQETRDLVEKSAQLQFRSVLVAAGATVPEATTTPSPGATPSPTGSAGADGESAGEADPTPSPTASTNGAPVPRFAAATTPAPDETGSAPATPTAKPTDGSDLNWVDAALQQQFEKLDCTDEKNLQGGTTPDPAKPTVACSSEGDEKYLLGPAEVLGEDIDTATAGIGQNQQGYSTGAWVVNLDFDSKGTRKFADVTTRLAAFGEGDARNRFAIVLDGLVISAPGTRERIAGGQAEISGSFNQRTATALANQLKYGALPVSFEVETSNTISALLGKEQLERGLLAGLIGLLLVVIYSLLQYRALGLVTVFSLGIAAVITYGLVLLLGWQQGYRLSLPGIAGLIVAIGITADSFIVFFERVRDEIREGRPLATAVEVAWTRARRTILASDAVSFLAAVVLYVLAVGGVRGFAFTLGLTTLVDVIVVFLFTKPVVTLLTRTTFFGEGHKLSGFDPEHLGRTSVGYAGRGTVRAGTRSGTSIAERRAATAGAPADTDGSSDQTTGSRQRAGSGRNA